MNGLLQEEQYTVNDKVVRHEVGDESEHSLQGLTDGFAYHPRGAGLERHDQEHAKSDEDDSQYLGLKLCLRLQPHLQFLHCLLHLR